MSEKTNRIFLLLSYLIISTKCVLTQNDNTFGTNPQNPGNGYNPYSTNTGYNNPYNDPYNPNDIYRNPNDPFPSPNDPFRTANDPFRTANDPFTNQDPYRNPNDPFGANPVNPIDPYRNTNNEFPNVNDPFGNPNAYTPTPFNGNVGGNNYPYGNEFGYNGSTSTYAPYVPNYDVSRNRGSFSNSIIINEATYFIVASKIVRPAQIYKIAVSVLQTHLPITVRASIQRNEVEIASDAKDVKEGIPETLLMRVPPTSVPGDYKLRVEGLYDLVLGAVAFYNETKLVFSQRSMTIFIQLDKPVYKQNEIVRFRAIPINTDLKAFDDTIDIFMLDPNGHKMRRWLSRQSNLGTVSQSYQLSDQPIFGEWKVQVIAQGQVENATFLVEEYYQTRFEVNVTMDPFFFDTDPYLHGVVTANYTNFAPVDGNLTLQAIIRPVRPPGVPWNWIDPRPPIVTYLNLQEEYPFWIRRDKRVWNAIPHLNYFKGVYSFRYPLQQLATYSQSLAGMEVTILATVGDRFWDEIIQGYSTTRIYNSTIKIEFLGGSPQVVKPSMPFNVYIVSSYHDDSPLNPNVLLYSKMELQVNVDMREGGRSSIPTQELLMTEKQGVWKAKIDLRTLLSLDDNVRANEMLNSISAVRLQAFFKDGAGQRATAEALMLTHYSPSNHQIKVSTSTKNAKVGAYIIFHVQANFYLDTFHYVIMSKGIILITGQENMQQNIRTFAVTLSAEMAPVASIVVWNVGRYGDTIADSLTFPVNGISRNNFTVFINNKKARTGEKVEVAIYGEPGSYVGLSGIDWSFYTMQAGNELTYAQVLTKMGHFGEQTNGTLQNVWFYHEGSPDELVSFPASTLGIDANRTFEYVGLVVFTDVALPRRQEFCNHTLGMAECLNGRCYRLDKRCDGFLDCDDGTDESLCNRRNSTELLLYRKFRFNRVQRQYDNVWLWHDVNIGPHGRYVFTVDVPRRPTHWIISAFSMSPSVGFGMLQKPIEYIGILPFYINVEMPTRCRQGEQIGIRVAVFNYMTNNIEATVILNGSPDYKFVHVEADGIVNSYAPRTSGGEHQFFIYIKAQDAALVYVPIVPTRLGDIDVTIHASALIGKDKVTRRVHVTADGLPQYRHQSVLLDLSNRAYAFQYMHVNVTETPIIPYEVDRYYVYGSNQATLSVVGDVVGPIFPTMPVNATSLLDLPMDCAEQSVFSFAANMYTTLYMRYINQRNRTLEREAFYHMNIGYQRQMSFMKQDGSFSLFRSDWNNSDSSVWLTACIVRILQEATFYEWENYIYIDPEVLSKAVRWLLRHQSPEGAFYEVTWLPDRKQNHSLNWDNDPIRFRNISLTAHVIITLEAVKDLASGLGAQVALAQSKAIAWLDRNMKLLEEFGEPFEIAIVTFALTVSKTPNAEHAFGLLMRHARTEGELIYWGRKHVPQPPYKIENQKPFLLPRLPYEYDSENIQTTAYALMVHVIRQELIIDPIVKWLNSQRLTDGGWASTQDTAVAMKALIEYTTRTRIRDVSALTITIEATSLPKNGSSVLYINNRNLAHLQKIDIPHAWGTVKVQAKGAGYAILQMHVQYNVDNYKFQTSPPVPAFDLRVRPDFHGRNKSHISFTCCQRWTNLNESVRSGMAVLDVAVPTGYIVQQQDLDLYIMQRQVRHLMRAKFLEQKVVFYFDYLDHEETCVNFTIERWYPVANMSRYLPIRVYDYYAPERFNETIFDALPTYLLNICEVCGSSQCPYCPIYNAATTTHASTTAVMSILCSVFVIVWHRNLYVGIFTFGT